jgi:metal-sulfur cluster biosynthetic enzyme
MKDVAVEEGQVCSYPASRLHHLVVPLGLLRRLRLAACKEVIAHRANLTVTACHATE